MSRTRLRVLLVEDSPDDAELIAQELERAGYEAECRRVDTPDDMRCALTEDAWDVVLSDYSMPTFDARRALAIVQEHALDVPFIIVSGSIGEDVAVAAMRAGAHDYFRKENLPRLGPAIARELRMARARRRRRQHDRLARFTLDVASAIAAPLDLERLAATLADGAVPELADAAFVVSVGDDGARTGSAEAHRDPAHLEALRRATAELASAHGGDEGLAAAVLGAGAPLLLDDDDLPPHEPAARGVQRWALIPLRARERPLGLLGLGCAAGAEQAFCEDDLPLARELAEKLSTLVDNARLYRAAQEAIRARDAFLTLATHELNTPLTSLLLNVQALAERLARPPAPGPTDVRRKVGAALRGTLRLHAIVSNLLDLTRLRSGALTLARQPIDLAALARETAAAMADQAGAAGCALDVDAPAPVVASVDPARMTQALGNLLTNAFRFAAGAPVRVIVNAVPATGGAEPRARLEVLDAGPGISHAVLPRLFDEFQGGDTARQQGGLGLGLVIARGVVRQHGGDLTASNRPGCGAAFIIDLPL